ncbi:MAG: hypothetical protein ACFFDJ_05770 [Candidatus Odinarchaeota archaeon]
MTDTKVEESLHHKSERRAMHIITDAVFGLALGLAAFSLVDYQITIVEDVYFAIGFFAITFFLLVLFWIWIRRFFEDLPVYGGAQLGILFGLCFLVAILPFIMRLFFTNMYGGTPEVATLALVTLYPLVMGAIGLLVGLLHLLFLKQARVRTPWDDYKHIASDSVAALALGSGFLITALIPPTMIFGELLPIGLPPPLATLPARFGIWIPIAIICVILFIVVEVALRRMQPSPPSTNATPDQV